MDEECKSRRLLIKISGEALKGDKNFGLSPSYLAILGQSIKDISQFGYELAIVIGGGNFFRGNTATEVGLTQVEADQMGMLATVMNGIALKNLFINIGLKAVHVCAYSIKGVADPLPPSDCQQLLKDGYIVIFSAGLGRPFFTTDTAAVSRSLEINADLLIKGTNVDGVYSADPHKDPNATCYSSLSYAEVIHQRLQIMDQTAFTLAQEHKLPIKVINISDPSQLKWAIETPGIGTIIQ